MTEKILVVDDDATLVKLVDMVLRQKGYLVLKANSGQEALRLFFAERPDLVLLDVVMPGMDGWQTCSRIREISEVPVIMLTGQRTTEDNVVQGLEHGADEYLIKPVGNRELVARVRAALRRAETPGTPRANGVSMNDGFLSVSVDEHRVAVGGKPVRLTPREFRLLALLLENAGRIVTHRQILERVWGWEYIDDVDYVRIYVSHVRQKIEPDPDIPQYILTEPGVGYSFRKIN